MPGPIDYEWEASFVIRGSDLSAPWFYNGFHLENEPTADSPRRITGVYQFTTETAGPIVEETARRAVDNLLNALTITTYYMNATDLTPIENFDIKCTNIGELIRAGQQIPTEFRTNYNVTRTFHPNTLTTILQQYQSIANNRAFPVIDRIVRIFRFARAASDRFVKFDFLWKAFNAFYDYVYEESTGRNPELAHVRQSERFRRFVDEVVEPVQATSMISECRRPIFELNPSLFESLGGSSIMDLLINRGLTVRVSGRTVDFSQELRTLQAAGNDMETLKELLNCLYVIRCQIAHGDLYSQNDQDFVYACSMILGAVLRLGLNNYLQPIVSPAP